MTDSIAIATGITAAAGTALLARGLFSPASQLFAPVLRRLPAPTNEVCLTFDDGPFPGSTDPILDMLRDADIRATFFVIGRYAQAHPHLLRRMHAEGHAIGNHTFDHHRWGLTRGLTYWHNQITRCDAAIHAATGLVPAYFRPPMGFKCPPLAYAVRRKTIVGWSCSGKDGISTTPDHIIRRASAIQPGDILLLHDGRDPASTRDVSATLHALPHILQNLRTRGLIPVTLA